MRLAPVLVVTLSAAAMGAALLWRYGPETSSRLATTRALYDWCYGERPPLPPTDQSREGRLFDSAAGMSETALREAAAQLMPTPTDEDRARVADDLEAGLVARYPRQRSGEASDRVRRLVERLEVALPDDRALPPQFQVLASANRNAFMAPGARGFVLRGLVDHVDTDQLAFVLAHEIAHAELGHDDELVRAALVGGDLAAHVALPERLGTRLGAAAVQLPMMLYDQRREFAADRYALCLTTRAGFDPLRASSAVRRLAKDARPAPVGISRVAYDVVATHPPAAARERYLATLLARLRRR